MNENVFELIARALDGEGNYELPGGIRDKEVLRECVEYVITGDEVKERVVEREVKEKARKKARLMVAGYLESLLSISE